jgi:hypothetical protein
MKLPNGDQAVIDPRKVTDYCLSPDHDEGKHKARVFQELLGVTLDNGQRLLDALKEVAGNRMPSSGSSTSTASVMWSILSSPGRWERPSCGRPGSFARVKRSPVS